MNKITIIGNVGRDVRLVETKNGNKFVTIVVASNDIIAGKEKTQWFDVTWFNYNENFIKYVKKGSGLFITGTLDTFIETGADGNQYLKRYINADFVGFAPSSKKDEDGNTQTTPETPTVGKMPQATPPSDDEMKVMSTPKSKKVVEPVFDNSEESDLPF